MMNFQNPEETSIKNNKHVVKFSVNGKSAIVLYLLCFTALYFTMEAGTIETGSIWFLFNILVTIIIIAKNIKHPLKLQHAYKSRVATKKEAALGQIFSVVKIGLTALLFIGGYNILWFVIALYVLILLTSWVLAVIVGIFEEAKKA